MISVQDALRILHENIPEPRRERVSLDQAYNCYLSEDILSPEASPRYTNSAMDGFAVRISTGAMLPDGTDSVVRVEDTRETGAIVKIHSIRTLGQDVRYEGEEFERGLFCFRKVPV